MEPQQARNRVNGIHHDRRGESSSDSFTFTIDHDDPDKGMFNYSSVRQNNALSQMQADRGTPYAYGLEYGRTGGPHLSTMPGHQPPQMYRYDE